MSDVPEIEIRSGKVETGLKSEFPGLCIFHCRCAADTKRSPSHLREQLTHLSNRVVGERAIEMRREPIASAYRIFFRQIGVDPDETRPPAEEALVGRLQSGRYESDGLLSDALTVAVVESGVALNAFDARAVAGDLELRLARSGETLDDPELGRQVLRGGTILVADARRALAPIFGPPTADAVPSSTMREAVVYAIGVQGVPELTLREALRRCATGLTGGRPA